MSKKIAEIFNCFVESVETKGNHTLVGVFAQNASDPKQIQMFGFEIDSPNAGAIRYGDTTEITILRCPEDSQIEIKMAQDAQFFRKKMKTISVPIRSHKAHFHID